MTKFEKLRNYESRNEKCIKNYLNKVLIVTNKDKYAVHVKKH